jgi:ribonuclease P/MRP protein subunit RPP40
MFERDINSRTRGHSFKMRKRRCTTEIRRNFFSERVVKNWNALDEETVMAKTVNSFKKKLKQNRDVKMGLLMD